jgi:septal ring factor EnvC (AmiA/AmiB activator)
MSDAVTLSLITTAGGLLLALNTTVVAVYVRSRLARSERVMQLRNDHDLSELERLRKQTDEDRAQANAELRTLRLNDSQRRQAMIELEDRCAGLEARVHELEADITTRNGELADCNEQRKELLAILARMGLATDGAG